MHNDIIPILYGENIFYIGLRDGLPYLQTLSDKALASVKFVHVRLNIRTWTGLDRGVLDKNHIFKKLQGFCKLFRRKVKPLQMDFSLSGPIENIKTARKVASTLKSLPKMKDCAICLPRSFKKEFSILANTVAVEMTGITVTNSDYLFNFAFSRLPKELRDLVLSYTELVHRGPTTWSNDRVSVDRVTVTLKSGRP